MFENIKQFYEDVKNYFFPPEYNMNDTKDQKIIKDKIQNFVRDESKKIDLHIENKLKPEIKALESSKDNLKKMKYFRNDIAHFIYDSSIKTKKEKIKVLAQAQEVLLEKNPNPEKKLWKNLLTQNDKEAKPPMFYTKNEYAAEVFLENVREKCEDAKINYIEVMSQFFFGGRTRVILKEIQENIADGKFEEATYYSTTSSKNKLL